MLILVEGVDGSGKTTLVNALVEEYGYHRLKGPDRQDYKNSELDNWLDLVTYLSKGKTYILDRSWITEFVYRQSDTDPTYLTLESLVKLFSLHPCKVVLCQNYKAFEDAMARGEDNITDENRSNIIAGTYNDFWHILKRFTNIPVAKYDWRKGDTPVDIVKFINS